MYPFRNQTPKHRKGRKICKHYTSYRKTLRIDFLQRCAYCNDMDNNRIRSFVIDHFIPQTPDQWTHSIPPNRYTNLMYACSFCNGAKINKWPTKSAKMFNNGTVGFIKPTVKLYGSVFRRDKDGSILIYNNHPVATYIHKELNLGLPIHSLNWRFEKFLEQEKILEELEKSTKDLALKDAITKIKLQRQEISDSINEIYNA